MDEIFTRTSVRSFSEQMPTDGQIEQILKAAMQAPSAANQRPWEFYVVKNRELLSLLSGVSSYGDYVKDAPLAIVICFKKSELKFPAYVPFDCACAAMNIWLCAEGLGLGTVWSGIAPEPYRMGRVREILSLPAQLEPFCIMPIGFASRKLKPHSRFEPERIHFL